MSIEINPIARRIIREEVNVEVKVRDLKPYFRFALRRYLELVGIPKLLSRVRSCEEKSVLLETIVNTGMDSILPQRRKKSKADGAPWISSSLSNLIRE